MTSVEPDSLATPNARHLVLVGLMGAGKTSVGALCATTLQRPFVDTDDLVAATAHRSVPEIFADDGETVFRALERQAVADACASPDPLVIACGGGAVLDAENRQRLRAHGCVIWLRGAPDVLAARVGPDGGGRPLLASEEPGATLARLEVERSAAYEGIAHATVDTDRRDQRQVADAVIEEFARCAA
jgi:shikimate kinase